LFRNISAAALRLTLRQRPRLLQHNIRAAQLRAVLHPFSLSFPPMERSRNLESARETLTKNNRRRSLKNLFQLPLSTRSSVYGSSPAAEAVGSLPADIVREIVDLLSPADVLSLSLTVSSSSLFNFSATSATHVGDSHRIFEHCSCRHSTIPSFSSQVRTARPLWRC